MIKKYQNHTTAVRKALHSKHCKHPFQSSMTCNKDNFVAFSATYICNSEFSLEL